MSAVGSQKIYTISQQFEDCTMNELDRTKGAFYCLITNHPQSISAKKNESDKIDELYTAGLIQDQERIVRKFKLWCTMDKRGYYLPSAKKIAELAAVIDKSELEDDAEVVESKFAVKKIVYEFNNANDKIQYCRDFFKDIQLEEPDNFVLFLKNFSKNGMTFKHERRTLPHHFQNSALGEQRQAVGDLILRLAADLHESSLDNVEPIKTIKLTIPEIIHSFEYPYDLLPEGIIDPADGWLWMTPNQYKASIYYFNNEYPSCIDIGPKLLFADFKVEIKKSLHCLCDDSSGVLYGPDPCPDIKILRLNQEYRYPESKPSPHKKYCPDINNYGQIVPAFNLVYTHGLGIPLIRFGKSRSNPYNPLEDNISLNMDSSNTKLEVIIGPSQDKLFFTKGRCNHRVLFAITFDEVKPAQIEYYEDVPCELFRNIILSIRRHPYILMLRNNLLTF